MQRRSDAFSNRKPPKTRREFKTAPERVAVQKLSGCNQNRFLCLPFRHMSLSRSLLKKRHESENAHAEYAQCLIYQQTAFFSTTQPPTANKKTRSSTERKLKAGASQE